MLGPKFISTKQSTRLFLKKGSPLSIAQVSRRLFSDKKDAPLIFRTTKQEFENLLTESCKDFDGEKALLEILFRFKNDLRDLAAEFEGYEVDRLEERQFFLKKLFESLFLHKSDKYVISKNKVDIVGTEFNLITSSTPTAIDVKSGDPAIIYLSSLNFGSTPISFAGNAIGLTDPKLLHHICLREVMENFINKNLMLAISQISLNKIIEHDLLHQKISCKSLESRDIQSEISGRSESLGSTFIRVLNNAVKYSNCAGREISITRKSEKGSISIEKIFMSEEYNGMTFKPSTAILGVETKKVATSSLRSL